MGIFGQWLQKLFGKGNARAGKRGAAAGLSEVFAAYEKNAIAIKPAHGKKAVATGGSKLGGKPHVAPDFVWPRYEGEGMDGVSKERPLAFLAQFNLRDLKPLDKEDVLPDGGILYFFYEASSMPWGFDPKDKGAARVLYRKEPTELSVAEFPDDLAEEFRIPETALSFEREKSLPEDIPEELFCADFDADDWDEAREAYGCSSPDFPDEKHKLLGYADIIQGEMEEECERVTSGIYCGEWQHLDKAEERDIKERSREWTLLLQLGTIAADGYELMWGDSGCLYFYIKKGDLARGNFDRVWAVLQCF